nr:immunoglobulin heavy chain junction region [Macaca mulatta]MOV36343.1 immunoglobulin heavy chain junction region [Macaca mulatta]MOV36373.1 immunoglobulin heavy chain junction region [Macaca mulatta]
CTSQLQTPSGLDSW